MVITERRKANVINNSRGYRLLFKGAIRKVRAHLLSFGCDAEDLLAELEVLPVLEATEVEDFTRGVWVCCIPLGLIVALSGPRPGWTEDMVALPLSREVRDRTAPFETERTKEFANDTSPLEQISGDTCTPGVHKEAV